MSCPSQFGFSQRCRLDTGHEGRHESEYITWTDQQAATTTESITKQMGDRTE